MGKSKRNRNVSMTQTKKKTKAFKVDLVDKVREYVDKYENIFVFRYDNMRTVLFRSV